MRFTVYRWFKEMMLLVASALPTLGTKNRGSSASAASILSPTNYTFTQLIGMAQYNLRETQSVSVESLIAMFLCKTLTPVIEVI